MVNVRTKIQKQAFILKPELDISYNIMALTQNRKLVWSLTHPIYKR